MTATLTPPSTSGSGAAPAPAPHKKSKAPLIIISVLAAIIIGLVGFIVFAPSGGSSQPATNLAPVANGGQLTTTSRLNLATPQTLQKLLNQTTKLACANNRDFSSVMTPSAETFQLYVTSLERHLMCASWQITGSGGGGSTQSYDIDVTMVETRYDNYSHDQPLTTKTINAHFTLTNTATGDGRSWIISGYEDNTSS